MRDFRNLKLWGRAHELALEIYRITAVFPPAERFGLTGQMRRAAVSVPANLAEGCGRKGDVELARFCRIASGSLAELACHLLLARDLGFLDEAGYVRLGREVDALERMLHAFLKKLKARSS